MSEDKTDSIPEFIRWNAVFDGNRGQDARIMFPELQELFDASPF
jgi:hypothetical protein